MSIGTWKTPSTPRTARSVLLRGLAEQPRGGEPERDEERVQGEDAEDAGRPGDGAGAPKYERDEGDERLHEGGDEQGARHARRPQAREGGAEDEGDRDGAVHEVGGVVIADDADGAVDPDEEHCGDEHEAAAEAPRAVWITGAVLGGVGAAGGDPFEGEEEGEHPGLRRGRLSAPLYAGQPTRGGSRRGTIGPAG